MNIINYEQQYEARVVDLWNKSCSYDSITVAKFRKQALFDDNFDAELCWVALDGEEVVGFIMATKRKFPYLERGLEPTKGWINVLFVDEQYRRLKVATKLLKLAEETLISQGVSTIILGAYSPNYFFAGLDPVNHACAVEFFKASGYDAGAEHYSMAKDLHGFVINEKNLQKKQAAEAKGFKFLNFDYSYSLQLLNFLKEEFGGGWKRNALNCMREGNAEDAILIVLDKENQICGFCMRMIDGNPMRFGPIGIKEKNRNDGLGSILINLMLDEMAKRGIYHMYFITTDEPGRRYYERQGLSVFRTFIEFKKEIV